MKTEKGEEKESVKSRVAAEGEKSKGWVTAWMETWGPIQDMKKEMKLNFFSALEDKKNVVSQMLRWHKEWIEEQMKVELAEVSNESINTLWDDVMTFQKKGVSNEEDGKISAINEDRQGEQKEERICFKLGKVWVEVLNSPRRIKEEGQRMHHCVGGAGFIKEVEKKELVLFHLSHEETEECSTLSVSREGILRENKGKYNSNVKNCELLNVSQKLVQEVVQWALHRDEEEKIKAREGERPQSPKR